MPIAYGSGDWVAVGTGGSQPIWIAGAEGSGLLYAVSLSPFDPEFPADQYLELRELGTAGNPAGGTTISGGAKVSPGGKPGATGATGATGPTPRTVRIPGSLTTSSGLQKVQTDAGPLGVSRTIPANSIKFYFGTGYSASNSANWTWQPGYMTPGNPGTFTAIGSGRQNNVAGGAAVSKSVETYTHPEVTIPAGSVEMVTCLPTNFPSANDGPADTVVTF